MNRRWLILLAGAVLWSVAPAVEVQAQRADSTEQSSRRQRGNREIERQLQRRVFTMMKDRLALTDQQLKQLEAATTKLEPKRRQVRSQEYRLRVALRRQVLANDPAANDSIAVLLARMPEVERLKVELMEAEQRELAAFLTPLQRAKYLALQDEIRRSMEEIRGRRTQSDSTSRRRRPSKP